MGQLSKVKALTAVVLESCWLADNTLPQGVLQLPRLARLSARDCRFGHQPPLAPLPLCELDLSDNSALADLRPGSQGLAALRKLTLQGTTPINERLLVAVKGVAPLRQLVVTKRNWQSGTAAFGHLAQIMHAKGGVLTI